MFSYLVVLNDLCEKGSRSKTWLFSASNQSRAILKSCWASVLRWSDPKATTNLCILRRNEIKKSLDYAVARTTANPRIWSLFWSSHQRFFKQLWWDLLRSMLFYVSLTQQSWMAYVHACLSESQNLQRFAFLAYSGDNSINICFMSCSLTRRALGKSVQKIGCEYFEQILETVYRNSIVLTSI